MKIYRFKYKKRIYYGVLKENILYPVKGSIYRKFKTEDTGIPISETHLLPPVMPSKIVAVGRNYKDHASEMGKPLPSEPLIFLKPSSAVIGPNDVIIRPAESERVDYEGELALVVKKNAYCIRENEDANGYILGYACFNDVTARDLQQKDIQFTRAKSFDTFAAIGPCISMHLDPACVQIKTFLNGKLKQSGNTKNLIFSIPVLLRFISRIMTLYPGDVITTGTPAGVGPMQRGDRIDIQIQGIGTLSNMVE